MKLAVLLSSVLLFSINSWAQKEFFKSDQSLTSKQLDVFYSSLGIHDDLLLFVANDYTLYVYDKNTSKLMWSSPIGYKSNNATFINGKHVFAAMYEDKEEFTVILDAATGARIRKTPFGILQSRPFVKNGVLYGTAMYEAGCLVAYDIAQDSILWYRFLAHGFSEQPYYFDEYIQANAESDNWVRLTYNGQLLDTNCKERAKIFIEDIPCVRNFTALTHDRKEVTSDVTKKLLGDEFSTPTFFKSQSYTYILRDDELWILGDNLKLRQKLSLNTLLKQGEDEENASFVIGAEDETVALLHADHYIVYDHKKKKLVKDIDLSNWKPHRLIVDGTKIWLISRKDGLLYGISI